MIRSKYLNKTFGNWTCTHVGIAYVSGKKLKSNGTRNYYYIFERRTSDGLADKLVRLNSSEASRVYKGELSVEEVAEMRKANNESEFARKVSYHFVK